MIDEGLLPLLPSLVALIEESGVSGAARRRGVSQPRMSARLADLRRLLGDPLLTPSGKGRGLTPTERGRRLAELSRLMLKELECRLAEETFDPERGERTFHILANDNAAKIVGGPLIRALRWGGRNRVRLAFHSFQATRLADLETGDLDLALGTPSQFARHGTLMTRTLLRDRFVTIGCAKISYPPSTLEEFCARPHVIVSGDGGGFEGLVDAALSRVGRSRHVAVSVQSYLAAIDIVRDTDLLATLPERLVGSAKRQVYVVAPPVKLRDITLGAAWHPRANDAANRWLREQLWSVAWTAAPAG